MASNFSRRTFCFVEEILQLGSFESLSLSHNFYLFLSPLPYLSFPLSHSLNHTLSLTLSISLFYSLPYNLSYSFSPLLSLYLSKSHSHFLLFLCISLLSYLISLFLAYSLPNILFKLSPLSSPLSLSLYSYHAVR